MAKAIVTGANGFLGKTLVTELLSRGFFVIAIDIKFTDKLANPNIKYINCLDKDIEKLSKEISSDVNYLFHLAWAGTSGETRADYNVQLNNVKVVCDYIQLCKNINCSRFIYASSINEMETYEYLQSDDIKPTGGYIYGTGKLAAHLMGETLSYMNKIDFIPVIITNIYGVGEKSARLVNTTIRKLLNKEHCSFTEGMQTYDFIYLTDAVNSIIEVAKKGKAFNRYYIGSGSPKALRDFLVDLKDVVDPSAELGLAEIPFNGINLDYSQFKLDKVEKDTGYINKVSFKEGIYLTSKFIQKEG